MNLTNRPVTPKGEKRKRQKPHDREYLTWLRLQKSALSGKEPCDPCHYRTAYNSGIATKPLYSAIPLTREEHLRQHQIGQFNFMPREWWDEQLEIHLLAFVQYCIDNKQKTGYKK